ncbi:B- and T-lymphocyte attenuator isoform X1 [Talpa occidentalis]|uniref:B- and T-lymphocyte attenuator isoform X1 n=1 Tax=Talpa occidentalis TaxID=50954 RepID=UPI00188F8477|nr:B- and T-lymphocyte attenuator isoform X1 [Talpa occidentalis]
MLGIGKLFWVLFLDRYLGIWSTDGEKSCLEIRVKRNSIYTAQAGQSVDLECPVKYCGKRPNMTWCKLNATCLSIEDKLQGHMSWMSWMDISVFVLHFNQVRVDDTGSYRCSARATNTSVESHTVTLHVTEKTENCSERCLGNITSDSGTLFKKEKMGTRWILHSLVALGGLLVLITCIYLFYRLRRHKGEQKKSSDTAGREINLVNVPQSFSGEQTEVDTRQNSQALPSEIGIYDNEPWSRIQDVSGVYSNTFVEENRQGIVYASLNHSVIGMNPRQETHVKEAPTEYAAICVRI